MAPVEMQLPLSADAAKRGRQVLDALIVGCAERRAAHAARGCDSAGILYFAGWDGDRGFFRGAGFGDAFWDFERGDGGEVDCADDWRAMWPGRGG